MTVMEQRGPIIQETRPIGKGGENLHLAPRELAKIRKLDDFDLIMLLSDIHEHGWDIARKTLKSMPPDPED